MLLLYCYVNSLGNGASCLGTRWPLRHVVLFFFKRQHFFLQANLASEQKDFHFLF